MRNCVESCAALATALARAGDGLGLRAPGGCYALAGLEETGGDADLAVADEALVILFQLRWQVAVVYSDSHRRRDAVGPQIAEGIDALQSRTVGKVKQSDGIV